MESTVDQMRAASHSTSSSIPVAELLHHTASLMLFSLGLSTLASATQINVPSPFTGTLLQIPLFSLLVGLPLLTKNHNLPLRQLQRGLLAIAYGLVLQQEFPVTSGSQAGLVVLTVVAITSFLAPIRIRQLGSANAISVSVIGALVMLALLA